MARYSLVTYYKKITKLNEFNDVLVQGFFISSLASELVIMKIIGKSAFIISIKLDITSQFILIGA